MTLRSSERVALRQLADAARPIFAAYRNSGAGHITEGQITAAWAAHDAAYRLLASDESRGLALFVIDYEDDHRTGSAVVVASDEHEAERILTKAGYVHATRVLPLEEDDDPAVLCAYSVEL